LVGPSRTQLALDRTRPVRASQEYSGELTISAGDPSMIRVDGRLVFLVAADDTSRSHGSAMPSLFSNVAGRHDMRRNAGFGEYSVVLDFAAEHRPVVSAQLSRGRGV